LRHKFFDVKNHPKFFNRANQTSTKFCYDNTGRKQTPESNKKRSEKLKGRIITLSARQKIQFHQLNRERTEIETKNRSNNMKKICKVQSECPYCNKQGQISGLKRWHFENCLKNPNLSLNRKEELLREREILKQNAILRNKNRANIQRKNEKKEK
jgi:hypothetical protein